jgi:predicted  nucleic acid-binding Zn-ribbon protein
MARALSNELEQLQQREPALNDEIEAARQELDPRQT